MASFSSRGPNSVASDIIKPDITAPGVNILAGNSPTPSLGFPGQLFQAISGTSMSSPHVAGVFALLRQAHPDWSAAMARSALMTTARQDVTKEDGVTAADPFDMGAGYLNPLGTQWEELHNDDKGDHKDEDEDESDHEHKKKDKDDEHEADITEGGTAFNPGLVYDAGLYDYVGFLCGATEGIVSASFCSFLESIGVPSDASDLNYPSIGIGELAGTQTVTRTVTNVSGDKLEVKAKVKAPAGYSVSVSPKKLKIPAGDQATFTVTITNDGSGPVGAWRFGSLTWKGDDYEVRSPIAVKAVLFNAPNEVSGTGEVGSTSFAVGFGYTGDYAATGHGLVAATVTSDTVFQDPDRSFDPTDGYSNSHTFTLTDAVAFRIAIPPEATEAGADLDVFVQDPDGNFVASSTKGGTDELVEIVNPMNGTWTVWVHGWVTPGGVSDYDIYTWGIPATSGGTLKIDSAPTSATVGGSGTIDVSWTEATAGGWYAGAVSHDRGPDILGITWVTVDNR